MPQTDVVRLYARFMPFLSEMSEIACLRALSIACAQIVYLWCARSGNGPPPKGYRPCASHNTSLSPRYKPVNILCFNKPIKN